MKNKKLIKQIKSEVKEQIKSDIRNSVVKEVFGNSKKEIKKLRKQVLKEVQSELFGSKKEKSKSKSNTEKEPENTRIRELYGFNFDSSRMGALVTGDKKKIKDIQSKSKVSEKPSEEIKRNTTRVDVDDADFNFMSNLPTQAGNFTAPSGDVKFPFGNPNYPEPWGFDDFFKKNSSKSVTKKVKIPSKEISEEKKEEITLFLGKLKEGVSKLRKDEKNINYRNKHDDVYNFSFERYADFNLIFDLDLDIDKLSAKINKFEFKIDEFKFDKKSIELLDIVQVLDLVGFNMNGYLHEIISLNEINVDKVKTETKVTKKTINSTTKVSSLIDDKRAVETLKNNGITTYGQLDKIEDLTSLKGIGKKTADKINNQVSEQIKVNTK